MFPLFAFGSVGFYYVSRASFAEDDVKSEADRLSEPIQAKVPQGWRKEERHPPNLSGDNIFIGPTFPSFSNVFVILRPERADGETESQKRRERGRDKSRERRGAREDDVKLPDISNSPTKGAFKAFFPFVRCKLDFTLIS